jgi:hypothetical protein
MQDIAKNLCVSTRTLSRRLAELTNQKGILTKYRELQGLQLTELQFSILESFTMPKLEEASLVDLARCIGILDKAIVRIKGKESKVYNLLGYLLELERTGGSSPPRRNSLTSNPLSAIIFLLGQGSDASRSCRIH